MNTGSISEKKHYQSINQSIRNHTAPYVANESESLRMGGRTDGRH